MEKYWFSRQDKWRFDSRPYFACFLGGCFGFLQQSKHRHLSQISDWQTVNKTVCDCLSVFLLWCTADLSSACHSLYTVHPHPTPALRWMEYRRRTKLKHVFRVFSWSNFTWHNMFGNILLDMSIETHEKEAFMHIFIADVNDRKDLNTKAWINI